MTNLRTFDTTGTTFRRIGKVLTITCEDDAIANRVADELRTEPAARPARSREEIAKIIDPRAFDELEKYRRLILADGKSEEQALKMAEYHWKVDCDKALAKADAILALTGEHGVVSAPVVSIKKMDLSDGRADYWVSIRVGDREVTPHVFREQYKANYHAMLYDWLLNGNGDEPACVDFGPKDWPALPRSIEMVTDERAFDLARRLKDHLTTEEAAVAIMEYATDAIEQIRREEAPPNRPEAETLRLMDILRSQEADSVTLCSDNPDFNGQPNCLVICNGDWTGWEDRRFQADTVLDALRAAAIEYRQKNSDGGLSPGNANVGDRIGRNRRPAHPMDTISGGSIGPSDPQCSDIDDIAVNATLEIEQLDWTHPAQRAERIAGVIARAIRSAHLHAKPQETEK